MKVHSYTFIASAVACAVGLLVGYAIGLHSNDSKHWAEGYEYAMIRVVETLARVDSVHVGQLIISEPNTFVDLSNSAIFLVDPNEFVEIRGRGSTIMGGRFEAH